MKIGIVTYWKSANNYGEQLQNYALQQYLRDMGHEPYLICYDYNSDTLYGTKPLPVRLLRACNPKRLIGYLKSRRHNRKLAKDCQDHPRGFEEFRAKHLKMSRLYPSIEDLKQDPPEADLYITGSDQVWNTFSGKLTEMQNRLRAFFLDFGPDKTLRMSYAASWGRSEISSEEAEFIRPMLSKFDSISVREAPGIGICKRLGRDDAVLALDPVLLHDAESYRRLYREDNNPKTDSKYLFFYYMNHDGKYDRKAVFDWAASKGLKVIYVTDDYADTFARSFPGVTEWLELIDNAEYVVTNSYHCTLFSLIFGKRFGVIRRFGSHKGMNSRLDSLFEFLGISPRYIDDEGFEVLSRPSEEIKNKEQASTVEQILSKTRE
ncbi:MAG: polysaccharide pyruvyl transferase family protein [Saccharofermentans sp.]|nr:polysaccharide pyruvyl transferase family protein [Saccharofermentans sp.]